MVDAAIGLREMDKDRRKAVVAGVRKVASAIAKRTRQEARKIPIIVKIRRYNPKIKITAISFARYSKSNNEVQAGVKTTGLLASIQLGLRARRWQLWPKDGTKGMRGRAKLPRGFVTFGLGQKKKIMAGGQHHKQREILRSQYADMERLGPTVDQSITDGIDKRWSKGK
jgi:hypothetical protein